MGWDAIAPDRPSISASPVASGADVSLAHETIAQAGGRAQSPADRTILYTHALLLALLAAAFLVAHSFLPNAPSPPWRNWWDQSRYMEAAKAWSELDLSAARHWYPPGYSLLGSLFQHVTTDQFLLPNLACLILSQIACACLARRMFPGWANAGLAGAATFLVTSIGTFKGMDAWLVPWTSTPATAATLLSLVAALRLAETPNLPRALIAGTAIGAITLFRPGDALPPAIAASLIVAPRLLSIGLRRAVWVAAGSVVSAAAVCALGLGLIAATSGFGPGTYYEFSSKLGFEFGLVPSRWVTLVVSGNPLYDGVGTIRNISGQHAGLAQFFPWIILGVGGMAACLASLRLFAVHVLLGVWLVLHMALMLSYRDLHMFGLWLFWNYHYFKPALPVFGLFGIALYMALADRKIALRSGIAAVAAITLAFGWRAELVPTGALPAPATASRIPLPSLDHLDDAAIVPATLAWPDTGADAQSLFVGSKQYANLFAFRLYRREHDVMIWPLRRLAPGDGVLHATGLSLAQGMPVVKAERRISFAMPCLFNLAGTVVCGQAGAPLLDP